MAGFRIRNLKTGELESIERFFMGESGKLFRLAGNDRLEKTEEGVFQAELSLGVRDKNGKEVFENDIVIGRKGWLSGDGHLKKKYPQKISLYLLVERDGAKFRLKELSAIPEHEEAHREKFYRSLEYTLEVSCYGFEDNEEGRYGKREDKRCMKIEVVSDMYLHKESSESA